MKLIAAALLVLASFTSHADELTEYNRIQSFAQDLHHYVSDQEQYGQLDKWAASLTGDCEDYALWVRMVVGGDLVIVRTQSNELHMVLKVNDYVFDNLSKDVYKFADMKHKLIVVYPDNHPDLLAFNKRM
ncbi:transglutaminase Cys peptidase [Shewanella sp. phage 3/49]|uniref:transglutaminase Cys peptidase n=1 Tax=Shewanella sp. phage 3/49 TaxID=1458863 RepID=UPI0004F72CEE|nr:transglutaminase Cys peptidase [Shewanella sp. phage 3/49]AHK11835.1 transglutaminase Cys peptidase [Shewanella sp. phage 3/49]